MMDLDPNNLYVQFNRLAPTQGGAAPRRYTAAHMQRENAVHLTIGPSYDQALTPIRSRAQAADALFAEWRSDADGAALHVFCGSHLGLGALNGGGCAPAPLIRQFVQAVRYADRHLFSAYPNLDQAPVFVHCGAPALNGPGDSWGALQDFRLPELQSSAFWTQFEMPTWQSLGSGYDPI